MSSTLTSYLVGMAMESVLGTPYARLIPASVNRCVRDKAFIVPRSLTAKEGAAEMKVSAENTRNCPRS